MIAQLPELYDDELIYSLLARYSVRSGLYLYRNVQEEIYGSSVHPTFEYINKMRPDLLRELGDIELIIRHHTMYGINARFQSGEKQTEALKKLKEGESDYQNYLWQSKNRNGGEKYARYCPVCAEHERKELGEAYWHRKHQIYGINICPEHHCYLLNSNLRITSKDSPALLPAEFVIPQKGPVRECDNKHEIAITEFMTDLIDLPFGMMDYYEVLKRKLHGSKYISVRGDRTYVHKLFADMKEYFEGFDQSVLIEDWQISKLMEGKYNNPLAIGMISVFLKITPGDLASQKLQRKRSSEEYDNQIRSLHKQGYNYRQISTMLGGSYDYIKAIGAGRKGKKKSRKWNSASGCKVRDYCQMDNENYDSVVSYIADLYSESDNRPERLSYTKVARHLGLTLKTIQKLPKCYTYISDHLESQEEYWIRELLWSYKSLKVAGQTENFNNLVVTKLNLKRKNIQRILSYSKQNSKRKYDLEAPIIAILEGELS